MALKKKKAEKNTVDVMDYIASLLEGKDCSVDAEESDEEKKEKKEVEEGVEASEDEEKIEEATDEEEVEAPVEEAAEELADEELPVEEAAAEEEDYLPVDEASEEELPAEEEAPVEEASDDMFPEDEMAEAASEEEYSDKDAAFDDEEVELDEAEKEFDVNDDSDVFLTDKEEEMAMKEAEEAELEPEEEKLAESEDDDEEAPVSEASDEEEELPKKPKLDMEEHVQALLKGEKLSESFKNKTKTIFEAAVKEKTLEYARNLKARYNKKLNKAKQVIESKLADKVDRYTDYVVTEWVEENKIAIEHGVRTELTESFTKDLKSIFEKHNIMVPAGKENMVDSLQKKTETLQKKLDEEVKRSMTLKKQLTEQRKAQIFSQACSGLAESQIDRFKSLTTGIQYDENYKKSLLTIKESYFSKDVLPKVVKKARVDQPVQIIESKEEVKQEVANKSHMDILAEILSGK